MTYVSPDAEREDNPSGPPPALVVPQTFGRTRRVVGPKLAGERNDPQGGVPRKIR
jgi:hypothetical protein